MVRSAAALAAALVPIGIAHVAGWVPYGAVFEYLARIEVIAGATILIALGYYVFTRRWRK